MTPDVPSLLLLLLPDMSRLTLIGVAELVSSEVQVDDSGEVLTCWLVFIDVVSELGDQ